MNHKENENKYQTKIFNAVTLLIPPPDWFLSSAQSCSCKCPFSILQDKPPCTVLPRNFLQSSMISWFPLLRFGECPQNKFPNCSKRRPLLRQSKNDRSFHTHLSSNPKLCSSKVLPVRLQKCGMRFGRFSGRIEGSLSVMNVDKGPRIDGLRYSMEFPSNLCMNMNPFWAVQKVNCNNNIFRTLIGTFPYRLEDRTKFYASIYIETIGKNVKNLEKGIE